MAAEQIPSATFTAGGQPSITNYEVVRWVTSRNYRDQDYNDQAGAFKGKLVFDRRQLTIDFELLCLASANPATDFPKGAKCAVTAYNTYFVEESQVESTEGVQRVTGRMVKVESLS